MIILVAFLSLNASSVIVAGVASVDASVSFRRVFDAVDSNGDHSITEEEFADAVERLVGGDAGGGGGVGAAVVAGGAAADGGPDPPPLGMDADPSMFRRPRKEGERGADDGGRDEGRSKGRGGKFDDPASTTAFVKGLVASFSAIMATEIGDKTFFIAAVLSMRNDRAAVFGGAILALILTTVLSTLMGLVLPALMPRKYTHLIGGALFLYFGFKLLNDSRTMKDGVSEELEEVEEELAEMSKKKNRARKKRQVEEKKGMDRDDDDCAADDNGPDDVEGGGGGGGGTMENGGDSNNVAKKRRGGSGGAGSAGFAKGGARTSSGGLSTAGEYSGNSWESVFLQALTLTFLAEWGDRSQIATIALAAAKVRDRRRCVMK